MMAPKIKSLPAMLTYQLSPYVHFIEDHLNPAGVEYGIVHRLTGEVARLSGYLQSLLFALKVTQRMSLDKAHLEGMGEVGAQVEYLIEKQFLVPEASHPLDSFWDWLVVRPAQNPALAFRSESGELTVVRISMEHVRFSPRPNELPPVTEEKLTEMAAEIFLRADGTKTLGEISTELQARQSPNPSGSADFEESLAFLTGPERQLIKLAPIGEDLSEPNKPFNAVPRNLSHSLTWKSGPNHPQRMINFHQHGIEDASWEFDWVEPTVNHAFRFPSDVLGGLNYGSRFCRSTIVPEVISSLDHSDRLDILEIGGGAGSFAFSFIQQSLNLRRPGPNAFNYHIVELSPVLIDSQRKLLGKLLKPVTFFQQDAVRLDLPGHRFNLIIANEVIADFPMASVRRVPVSSVPDSKEQHAGPPPTWEGEGSDYIYKYDLPVSDAPDSFEVNAGVFEFLERAWKHLLPGGTLIMTEYGGNEYPVLQHYLNHEEYSIHFGHVLACAAHVGFKCRLLTLKEFLDLDDEVLMLDGSTEQIHCLNHVLRKFGLSLPYAAIAKKEFEGRFKQIAEQIGLMGVTFSALRSGFHYGPDVSRFKAVVLNKP
jgi:Putative S-adenosyl-L-methionine-dependent methyltransferase